MKINKINFTIVFLLIFNFYPIIVSGITNCNCITDKIAYPNIGIKTVYPLDLSDPFFNITAITDDIGLRQYELLEIQDDLKEIGINVTAKIIPLSLLTKEITITHNYDMCFFGLATYEPYPYFVELFGEQATLDFHGYKEIMDWNETLAMGTNQWLLERYDSFLETDLELSKQYFWDWQDYYMDNLLGCLQGLSWINTTLESFQSNLYNTIEFSQANSKSLYLDTLNLYAFNFRWVRASPIQDNSTCMFNPKTTTGLTIRKAIAYAIDWNSINEDIRDGAYHRNYHPVFDSFLEWKSPTITKYDFNLTKAKELMIEAGYNITLDSDGDGLDNYYEFSVAGTDPYNMDTDQDGLNDFDEIYVYFTDPLDEDTDGDGYTDGDEIENGTDPLVPNSTPVFGPSLFLLICTIFGSFIFLSLVLPNYKFKSKL